MNNVAYIVSGSGNINIVIGDKSYVVATDHTNYKQIVNRLKDESYEGLEKLIDVSESIKKASDGKVAVVNGSIFYNGSELINALTERILAFIKQDMPFKPMLRFLDNLMLNPSKTSVQELFLFLEKNSLPITDDGCFLAYKKVDDNLTSFHPNPDGTHEDHSVGKKPRMPRNMVDDIRDNVCSTGFHFCSLSYLPQYHGGQGKTVILKINPEDVVSIPSDYNNSKGRACGYEVIAVHTDGERVEKFEKPLVDSKGNDYQDNGAGEEAFMLEQDVSCVGDCGNCGTCIDTAGAVNTVNQDYGIKPSGQKFHNVRDSKGHFIKKS